MSELLHIDLCAGKGGWQIATEASPSWTAVGIDILPMDGVDIVGDIRHLPIDCRPDLLTMSPPCTEFARWMLPWCDEPEPSLELVESCMAAVESLNPRYWILENSRGLHMYWKPARTRVGPYYLWGEFPPFDVDTAQFTRKTEISGTRPEDRAMIPAGLSRAVKQSIEWNTPEKYTE